MLLSVASSKKTLVHDQQKEGDSIVEMNVTPLVDVVHMSQTLLNVHKKFP